MRGGAVSDDTMPGGALTVWPTKYAAWAPLDRADLDVWSACWGVRMPVSTWPLLGVKQWPEDQPT